ncbi:MAG: MBL fold metallo-hydrolase, partial [Deltaproteobacteria bacterium]|nr:MBL fold metallo-hydrolase [Deltaproteobacteria bacterium]
MVAINQEYPNIGVIISQRTEFDHRSHYPEYETTTEQNGNFSLENIPYNDYIVVCEKSGFGYHYIFYLSLSTNNYELQTVNLLAERQVSGTLTENTTWESGRHYIVTSDVEVPEAVTLTIEPGAVIRFSTDPSGDGFYKLKVRGTLIAVGDSLNWINFTSNVGFSIDDISRVLLTHAHADHSGGCAALKFALGVPVIVSSEEADFLRRADEAELGLAFARSA